MSPQSGAESIDRRPGFLRRFWEAARGWMARGGDAAPFDFRSFEFPRLDIDRTAQRLRLLALAEENGRHEIPGSADEAFDAPQERILQFIRGEVATSSAIYETSLAGLNNRIRELDVPRSLRELPGVAHALAQHLETMAQRTVHGLSGARQGVAAAKREYRAFRRLHGIERDPHYPASKFNSLAVLVAVAVIEGVVNAVFFARGSDFGLVGGALYALLLAAVDILIVFNLGRVIAWVVSRDWRYRAAALTVLLFFVAWAAGFNLLIGHVREALQMAPDTAMIAARDSFVASPLGLTQADSWLLVAIGLVLSTLAMVDGLQWDDMYPGYGSIHRRLVLVREEFEHWKSAWREGAISLRGEHLDRIDSILRDVRREAVSLERTIETKALLLRNIRTFASHYEESCNALIRLYRDHNLRHRSTSAPDYFARPWRLRLSDRLSDSTDADRERLLDVRAAVAGADAAATEARDETRECYTAFVQRIEAEVSP